MNAKMMYAAGGGIAVLAAIVFFVIGPGDLGRNGQQPEALQQPGTTAPSTSPVEVSLTNVSASRTGNDTADIHVAFSVYNPGKGTVLFERISYNVFVDELKMASGDIGESPQGFLDSQSDIFPIVGNGTVVLKGTQPSQRNNLIGDSWDRMVQGNTTFVVKGEYAYNTRSSGLETSNGLESFEMTYP